MVSSPEDPEYPVKQGLEKRISYEEEEFEILKAHDTSAVPLQWIIPNLYLSQQLDRVVDRDQSRENKKCPGFPGAKLKNKAGDR